MTATTQIVLAIVMVGFMANGFYWMVKKHIAATIWMVGVALLVGMVIF